MLWFISLCICVSWSHYTYLTQTHVCTSAQPFPHYDLEWSAELDESRQQLSQPESQQAALHWRKGCYTRQHLSELDCPHQTFLSLVIIKEKRENTNRASLIGCKTRVSVCGWKREGGIQRHCGVMYHSANNNGKLEAEMMVHSYIFRSLWEAAFFCPNGREKNHYCSFFQPAHVIF